MIENKSHFKTLFNLSKKQPWLADKEEELTDLLFSECINKEEQSLILELLGRFIHISHDRFSDYLYSLVEEIATDPRLEDKNTLLVAMTGDSSPDSGQFVLYALKPIFEKMNWRHHIAVTNFQRAFSKFKSSGFKHSNIVLIDEFVGSGKTILGRVKTLKQQFSDHEVNIIVRALFSSEVGVKAIEEEGIDFKSLLTLDKGISSHYSGIELNKKLQLMERLEGILLEKYEDRELPNLGYGGTESLYTRDSGNTPNSVFPIFWWPFLKTNATRKTILIRAMGDA